MDELLKAILEDAIKESVKRGEKVNANKKPMENGMVRMAKETKMAYDEFIKVGFTQEQAFELVKVIIA